MIKVICKIHSKRGKIFGIMIDDKVIPYVSAYALYCDLVDRLEVPEPVARETMHALVNDGVSIIELHPDLEIMSQY